MKGFVLTDEAVAEIIGLTEEEILAFAAALPEEDRQEFAVALAKAIEKATLRIFRMPAHPIRVFILNCLAQGVASPSQMAIEMGVPLGRLSYHARQLKDSELIKINRLEPVRGALEHFYERPMDGVIEHEITVVVGEHKITFTVTFDVSKINRAIAPMLTLQPQVTDISKKKVEKTK